MGWSLKNVLTKIAVWLAAEIIFNFLGIDSLADYSEFLFETNVVVEFKSQFKLKENIGMF